MTPPNGPGSSRPVSPPPPSYPSSPPPPNPPTKPTKMSARRPFDGFGQIHPVNALRIRGRNLPEKDWRTLAGDVFAVAMGIR